MTSTPINGNGAAVVLRDVHKSFGANKVLAGVNLEAQRGPGDGDHRPQRLGQEHGAALHRPPGDASTAARSPCAAAGSTIPRST